MTYPMADTPAGPWYLIGRYENQTPETIATFDTEPDAITARDSYRWIMPRTWVIWVAHYSTYPNGKRFRCEGPGEHAQAKVKP